MRILKARRLTSLLLACLMVSVTAVAVFGAPAAELTRTFKLDCNGILDLAWDGTNLLVLTGSGNTVLAMDVHTGRIVKTMTIAAGRQQGIAANGDMTWLVDKDGQASLTLVEDKSLHAQGTLTLNTLEKNVDYISGFALEGQNVWLGVAAGWSSKLVCFDTSNGKVVRSFHSRGFPESIEVDGQRIWSATSNMGQFQGAIYEYDGVTGAPLHSYSAPCLNPRGLAFDGQQLWCGDLDSGVVYSLSLQ